jgi:uncharacterized membrane protein YbhN (UPF0104 family)
MTKHSILRSGLAYLIGIALLCWVARKVPLYSIKAALADANNGVFVPVRIVEFATLFLGECYLFARLFSFFQRPASAREMMRPNAARCFLQVINSAFGEGVFVLAVSRRITASFIGTGFSLLFLALIDFHMLLLMALIGALFGPGFPLQLPWAWLLPPIAGMWLMAILWVNGPPPTRLLQWLYNRPSLATFKMARPVHYARLSLIRAAIFFAQAFGFYLEFRAFAVPVTILQMVAALPVILLANGLPITPVGIGTSQAAIVFGFAGMAPSANLLALSLAHSGIGIGLRVLLGIFVPGLILAGPRGQMDGLAAIGGLSSNGPLEAS